MTNSKMAATLAERAKDHAERAGMAANDVDMKSRMGGLVPSSGTPATETPSLIAVAAMAHAHAALAYKEAALAYAALPPGERADTNPAQE